MAHDSTLGSDKSEPAGALGKEDEIEITPKMIKEGVLALSGFNEDFVDRETIVIEIYRSMVLSSEPGLLVDRVLL